MVSTRNFTPFRTPKLVQRTSYTNTLALRNWIVVSQEGLFYVVTILQIISLLVLKDPGAGNKYVRNVAKKSFLHSIGQIKLPHTSSSNAFLEYEHRRDIVLFAAAELTH